MKKEIILRENGSRRVLHHCEGESLTRQEFAKEADINSIMKRYLRTGEITNISDKIPFYGDVTQITDYQTALNSVIAAQDAFDSLPAYLRERFANDPAKLIDFLGDKNNLEEAVKLGLVEIKPLPSNPLPTEPVKTEKAEGPKAKSE